jgi:hypothetical protein
MSMTAPRRPLAWMLQAPEIPDVHAPRWYHRMPVWLSTGVILVLLLGISAAVRARFITGQLWGDEAISIGIASHPIGAIPGILRHDGSMPLYYLVLHVWMRLFGSGELVTHLLSLLLGLATVPVGMWAGWSLSGRRAGMAAAVLFAFSPFLTHYAEEVQPFELLALLGLIATACLLHAFVRRRRGFLIPLTLCLALALYTSFWAIFGWAGMGVAVWYLHRTAEDRAGYARDAAFAFGIALLLFVPWIPNLIYQIGHTTSPWGYGDLSGFGFPSSLLGSDRVTASLAVAFAVVALPLATRARRRSASARIVFSLMLLALSAALLARIVSIVSPVWETRYLATILAALLLLGAVSCARSGILGLVALLLTLAFAANAASFAPQHKSDLRDVSAELAPLLRPGDLVLVAAPEQTPLVAYYMPRGLRWANTIGPVSDPTYMDWVNAYTRLLDAPPRARLDALVNAMRPGQRLLYTRPLTEGNQYWSQSWAILVRRRAAQWGELLAGDPRLRPIAGAVAPHNYPSACCVADSAVVYAKQP